MIKTEENLLNSFFEEEFEEEEEEEEEENGGKEEEEGNEREEESEGGKGGIVKEKKYNVGGNEMTADEVAEAYASLEKDYTKKSQMLAELEKKGSGEKEEEEDFDPEDEKIADSLYKILKKKHGLLTKEEMEERSQLEAIDRTVKNLEEKYKGDDELPKFSTNKVLAYMKENNYPPNLMEQAFKDMHEKEFIAKAVKDTLAEKGGYVTENKKGESKKTKKEKPLDTKEDIEAFVTSELEKSGKEEL